MPHKVTPILFLIIICTLSAHTQSVRDSLDRLINNEQNDSVKTSHIIEILREPTLSKNEDILAYYLKGKKLARNLEDPISILRITSSYARKLSIIGNKEESRKMFLKLQDLAIEYKDTLFLTTSLSGIAAFDVEEGKLDDAKSKLYKTISLLDNSSNENSKISTYNQLANIYRNEGDYIKAHYFLDTIINLIKNDRSSIALSSALSSKGRIYRFQGKNDSAKIAYKKSEKVALNSGYSSSLAVIYNNLGNIEHVEGKYDLALEYYLKSLKIKEQAKDIRGTTIAYHNIGAILIEMQDWTKALEYFKKSNLKAEEIKFQVLIVHNENKIGEVLTHDSLFNQAIIHHKKALRIGRESGFKKGELAALYNLGNDYFLLNDLKQCNKYLIDALTLAREIKSKPQESSILVKLAETYLKSENDPQTNVKNVENLGLTRMDVKQYLLDANRMADEMNNVQNKILALNGLDQFYSNTNDTKAHLKVLQELIDLKDTIFANDRVKAVADWETKYETAEKEKEILELENEKRVAKLKSRQFKFFVLGIGVFMMGFLSFIAYWSRQKNKKKNAAKREAFRAKLSSDLHDDVGSTLTGLAMQSELLSNFVDGKLKQNAENIAALSREAMTRMRDTVWAIDSRKDKVDDLIGRMQDFAQTNLITKEIVFIFNTNLVDKNLKIEPEVRQNIYLIFKECIANILKHSNATEVNANLSIANKILHLRISNNGVLNSSEIKTSGVGLNSIKDRAIKMNGKYEITSQNGFTIKISIPTKF